MYVNEYGSISETSLEISSKPHGLVTLALNEEETALDLIEGLSNFLKIHATSGVDRDHASRMNIKPISDIDCRKALYFIKKYKDELIFVVNKEINFDEPTGLFKFYCEHKITLSDTNTAFWLSSRQVAQIKTNSTKIHHFFLTIINQAVDALSNHEKVLAKERLQEEEREQERLIKLQEAKQYKIACREYHKKQLEEESKLSPKDKTERAAKEKAEYEAEMQRLIYYYENDDEQIMFHGSMSIEEQIEKGFIQDLRVIHYVKTKREKTSCCTLF